jgi:hypothetical protein
LYESLGTKVLQVAATEISGPAVVVTKIIRRHHPEGPDRSERTCFGPTQPVFVFPYVDVLTLKAARQV